MVGEDRRDWDTLLVRDELPAFSEEERHQIDDAVSTMEAELHETIQRKKSLQPQPMQVYASSGSSES